MTTNDNLERELKKLYAQVSPPPGGLAAGRERMLAEAARLKAQFTSLSISNAAETQEPDRRRKMKLFLAYKIIAAIVAVVMGTTAAGGGIVLASADSLPGDTLYSVKLIVEDTRLALTADRADRAELLLSFAAQRTEEIGRLMAQGEPVPEDTLARMAQHTERIMVQIAHAEQEDIPGLLERVVERTRAQERVLEQARALAPEETGPALRWALEVTERTSEIASAAVKDPERFREEYRHRHEGTPGLDDGASPSRTPVPPCETCTPERDRGRDRDGDRTHTPEPTATPTSSPPSTSMPTHTPSPAGPCETCTPERDRDWDRDRDREREGTHTPEPTMTPTPSLPPTSMPTHTPSPAGPCETCTPEQDRDRDRDRDRDGDRTHTPSPTMTPTPSPPPASMPTNTSEPTTVPMPSPTSVPRPTHTPKPKPMHTPEPKSTHTPVPEPTHTPKHGGHGSGH